MTTIVVRPPLAPLPRLPVPTDSKGHPLAKVSSLAASTRQGFVQGAAFAPPANAATVQVDAVMNSTDILGSGANARTFQLYLGSSYDNGLSFQNDAWISWASGPNDTVLGGTTPLAPGVQIPVPTPAPGLYQPSINLPSPTFVGLTLTFRDAQGNVL